MPVAEVMAFFDNPARIQRVLLTMDQRERSSLVEATTIRFPNHARRLADGLCDGMAGDTKQYDDVPAS